MSDCPCCSDRMLRHIRHQEVYWFCRHCWQEMPTMRKRQPFPLSSLGLSLEASLLKERYSQLSKL